VRIEFVAPRPASEGVIVVFDGDRTKITPFSPPGGFFHKGFTHRWVEFYGSVNSLAHHNVIYEEGCSLEGFLVVVQKYGTLGVQASSGSAGGVVLVPLFPDTIDLGEMFHCKAVFDNGTLELWVNHVLKGSGGAPFTSVGANSNSPSIGQAVSGATSGCPNPPAALDGTLSWIKIGNEEGVQAWYKLDVGVGTFMWDASGHGRHAVLQHGTWDHL